MYQKKLLKETSFLVIDFETVTPKGRPPEPIELGLLRIINAYYIDYNNAKSSFIKPPYGIRLTKFDTQQTGIVEEDLMNAPSSNEVMKRLGNVCAQKEYIFIAQNAKYEANIISRFVEANPHLSKMKFVDTILLAKKIVPNLSNYKLDTIANALSIPVPKDRHRALPDCILTAQVFIRLLEISKESKEIVFVDDLLSIAEIQTKHSKTEQLKLINY